MAKGSIRIARKYARAMLSLYISSGSNPAQNADPSKLEDVRKALLEISALWDSNQQLRETIQNPAFNLEERTAALQKIASNLLPADQMFINFIGLLVSAGRINSLDLIAQAFSAMLDELKKTLALKVTSAFSLSEEEKNAFKAGIEKDFGSLASIEWEKDENIIGGLRVRAGDKLLDGSVRGALNKLQSALLN